MNEFEIVTTEAKAAIAIREKVRAGDVPQVMSAMFGELMPLLQGEVVCTGPPFAFYHSLSFVEMDMEVGFPVMGKGISKGRVKPFELPSVKAAVTIHIGPYDKLAETYQRMMEWMNANGHQYAGYMWEEYLNSPSDTPENKLMTRLIMPIK